MTDPVMGTQQDVTTARAIAFVLDHVLSLVAAVVLGLTLAVQFSLGEPGIWLGVFLGMVGYFVVLEGLFGQTVGKRLLGIVVVSRRSGDPCTMSQSLVRNLLRVVDGLFNYAVGLVAMLASEDRQRIGDRAAGTIVVKAKRSGGGEPRRSSERGGGTGRPPH